MVKVIFHRQRYRKRVITFFLPKPIFWSAKNMVWLIGWKILGIRDLQTCSSSQRIDLRTFRSTYEHFFFLNLYSNIVFLSMFSKPDQSLNRKSYWFKVHWSNRRLNRWCYKYIFYILLKFKNFINKNNKFYLN